VGGGLTRTFHLLKSLASRHEVTLAAFTYGERHERAPYPISVEAVPWQWSPAYLEMIGADAAAARRASDYLTYRHEDPWFASTMDAGGMQAALARIVRTPPDLILLEGTPLARFIPDLPAGVTRILDLFDVHTVMARRALEQVSLHDRDALACEAERTFRFERRAVAQCDLCLAVSDSDAAAARDILGAARVEVVPNGVDTAAFTPSPGTGERGRIVFTGRMNYAPNADAVLYFAGQVLPLVLEQVPYARFHVVGAHPPPPVSALASATVVVHGRVDDVRPYLASAEVVVVPIRAGGGTRLKVLEAAAAGKAIVTTRLGLEGLPFPGGSVVVADAPQAMADAVVALLRDRERRAALGARARAVAERFEWTDIGYSLHRIVESAGGLL
jgi:glycosyltransferase involved in cell wall biosynthesis